MRVGTLLPGAGIDVARGLYVNRCALYGLDDLRVKLEIGQVQGNDVVVQDCNTPQIRAIAERLAGELGDEAWVASRFLGTMPVSTGVVSGRFEELEPTGVDGGR